MAFRYSDKYKKYSLDMHVNVTRDEFLKQFDPEALAKDIISTGAEAGMMYIQSHYGYSYWPTKVGEMHPGLIGNEDAFKRLYDEMHKGGMDVDVYFSMIYNNWAYDHHPEWRIKDIDGHYSRDKGRRFGLCCPNSEGYKKFCRDQIADFTEYVGPYEAFFADMTFWPTVCYCDNCRARWEKEVGGEMPRIVNWRTNVGSFSKQQARGVAAGLYAVHLRFRQDGQSRRVVEMQNSTMPGSWMMGVTENATIASDAVSGDLYAVFSADLCLQNVLQYDAQSAVQLYYLKVRAVS